MPDSESLVWEQVHSENGGPPQIERAPIPGGWLVVSRRYSDGKPVSESITFVPDENHDWHGGSEWP